MIGAANHFLDTAGRASALTLRESLLYADLERRYSARVADVICDFSEELDRVRREDVKHIGAPGTREATTAYLRELESQYDVSCERDGRADRELVTHVIHTFGDAFDVTPASRLFQMVPGIAALFTSIESARGESLEELVATKEYWQVNRELLATSFSYLMVCGGGTSE